MTNRKNNNVLLVRLSDTEQKILDEYCEQEARSKTDVVRELVRSLKAEINKLAAS